jgi:hypothetical protein
MRTLGHAAPSLPRRLSGRSPFTDCDAHTQRGTSTGDAAATQRACHKQQAQQQQHQSTSTTTTTTTATTKDAPTEPHVGMLHGIEWVRLCAYVM